MDIVFTKHALDKFDVLARHNVSVTREQVIDTVERPEIIDDSRLPLLIAQRSIDSDHVLRVVYRQEGRARVIVTFYPGRRKKYEQG